ncbi:DUF1566 domain-containing protein [Paucibacter sp. JuS9]|uniref:Lcl C-terminal domain-containing protein n=1 Tax=Paucibacter sp. JuS9 TaxID=3228748 RepID=UPI003757C836
MTEKILTNPILQTTPTCFASPPSPAFDCPRCRMCLLRSKRLYCSGKLSGSPGQMARYHVSRQGGKRSMSGRGVVTAALCRVWAGLLVLGLACSAGVGAQTQYSPKQQTGPFVPVKDGALIWDASTGLVWMRCAVGQTWDGSACVRESSSFNLFSLQQARSLPDRFNAGGWQGHADWRLPTIGDLESLVQCRDDTKRILRGDGFICYSHDKPTIDVTYFPNILKEGNASLFRTSSSLVIDFADGGKMNAYAADHRPYFVRLVRSKLMVDDAAVSEIIPDWIKYQQEVGTGHYLVQWVSKIDKQASKRADVDNHLILKLVTARYAALEAQELASALSSALLPLAPVFLPRPWHPRANSRPRPSTKPVGPPA